MNNKKEISLAWPWVFTLVLAEGLIFVILMGVSMVMCKRLGVNNTWATVDTAVLCLPFLLRSFYKPLLWKVRNLRWWVVFLELLFAAVMMCVASAVQSDSWG